MREYISKCLPIPPQTIDHPEFHDLETKGVSGSMTGEKLPAIYGDLFTKLFNKDIKGSAGSFFFFGLSTDIDAVNYGQNTIISIRC